MNCLCFINMAKSKLGCKTDSELAKMLGVTPGSISHYRTHKRFMDTYTATKLALSIGIEPLLVISAALAESESMAAKRAFWTALNHRLRNGGNTNEIENVINAAINWKNFQSLENANNLYLAVLNMQHEKPENIHMLDEEA